MNPDNASEQSTPPEDASGIIEIENYDVPAAAVTGQPEPDVEAVVEIADSVATDQVDNTDASGVIEIEQNDAPLSSPVIEVTEDSATAPDVEVVASATTDASGVIEIEQNDVPGLSPVGETDAESVADGVIEVAQYDVPPSPDVTTPEPAADGVIEVVQYDVPAENDLPYAAQTVNPDTIRDNETNSYENDVIPTGTPVSTTYNEASYMATNQTPNKPASDGNFEDWVIMPDAKWPPPIFMKRNVSARERFYLEYRWHSQWAYYDSKATQNKDTYYWYQRIVVIGSLLIPALVSLNSTIARFITQFFPNAADNTETMIRIGVDSITVFISLAVAGSAALESLYKYGENWSSYRSAAEELQAEKNFYDMHAGPYANNPAAFATFVERVEGIVANQNGKFMQAVQAQIAKQAEENEAILDAYMDDEEDDGGDEEDSYTVVSPEPTI